MNGNRISSAKTQQQLAALVDRSQKTISNHLRDPDCPIPAKGPWTAKQVRGFKSWLGTLREDYNHEQAAAKEKKRGGSEDDPASPGGVRQIDVKLKAERMLKVRLEREILQNMYLPREKVETGWIERARGFKHGLDSVPDSIAPLLVGMTDPHEIAQIIRKAHNDVLEGYVRMPRPGLDDQP